MYDMHASMDTDPITTNDRSVCNFCDQESHDLRRCSGCYKVKYCSRKCQKKDWKRYHRGVCKQLAKSEVYGEGNQEPVTGQGSTPQKNSSSSFNPLLKRRKISQVHERDHSLPKCKKQNSADGYSKPNTRQSITDPSNSKRLPANMGEKRCTGNEKANDHDKSCHYCGNTGNLLYCSRCMTAAYCSKECQVRDWKSHKVLCVQIKGEINDDMVDDVITTDGFLEEEAFARVEAHDVSSWYEVDRKLFKRGPRDRGSFFTTYDAYKNFKI